MAVNLKKNIFSIIDANVNRVKEGLRVVEDIARFIYKDKKNSFHLKKTRHKINSILSKLAPSYSILLHSRDSVKDVGRKTKSKSELKRQSYSDIVISNFKRIQESLRVLEEISKLLDKKSALKFKDLRYEVYEIEKAMVLRSK
jgi:thiamine-phosphate pyrophosphorylase